jgi:hypothetical protein
MKYYFELSKKERVAIKRGDKYIVMVWSDNPEKPLLDGTWIRKFFEIPPEFQINPFDYSPTGDVFFADKRNLNGRLPEENLSFKLPSAVS